MALIRSSSSSTPISIDKFLGLNMNETGDTQLQLGESGNMVNFRITKNYKLEKMYGYKEIYAVNGKIRAQWKGKLGDKEVHIFVAGGKVYNGNEEIGTITDNITSIFEFNQKLYFLNGFEYKVYDGTELKEVEGYIPLIKISTTPDGTGTDYEPVNLLTGKKRQTFSADGVAKKFVLLESNVTSIDSIKVNGVETEATKDLANGKVTFANVVEKGVDNVEIQWTKGTGEREHIVKNLYFQKYGLANDTRVLLYGNVEEKNRTYFSDLGNEVANVEYFPGNNFIDVGSSNTAITDMNRQYDRLIISKENETYYASYDTITDTTRAEIITFPVYPLNSAHGMVACGQGQLLDNYVTTIDSSIVMWTNTNTKDERNVEIISQKIQEWLNSKDLSKAITLDYQEDKEYWLAIGNEIMIYNYGNGTFYLIKIGANITSLISSEGIIYLGTENGQIMQFGKELMTYNGEAIDAVWNSGYHDLGAEQVRKTMRMLWLTLKSHSKTSLDINYITDRNSGTNAKNISNRCIDYSNWNYADMTYNTQRSVKPYRIKLKAKKFAFLKLVISNNKIDEQLTINSLVIKSNYGGEVK